MPYKSAKQAAFFRLCKHNPSKANKACPPMKVLKEFEAAQQKRKNPKFH